MDSFRAVEWQPQPYTWLLQGNYSQAQQFYEAAIQSEPEVTSHYWYLGLLLLLQGQEAEAQTTWLMGMADSPAEQIEALTIDLTHVLQTEAKRREAISDLTLAWVIRQHIREIAPADTSNWLHLVQLSLQQNLFTDNDFGIIKDCQRLLETQQSLTIDSDLILKTLKLVLDTVAPNPLILDFTAACLPYIADQSALQKVLFPIALKINQGMRQPRLAAELLEPYHSLYPESLEVLGLLSGFYQNAGDIDRGLETARLFFNSSDSLPNQIYSNYLILRTLMTAGGYWQEAVATSERHRQLLSGLVHAQFDLPTVYISRLFTASFFLPYLGDDLSGNRFLQNRVASFCQRYIQDHEIEQATRYRQGHLDRLATSTATRPLRIGYLSHCLGTHSVGILARWLFQYHDRERFQIYGYFMTDRFLDPLHDWYLDQVDHVCKLTADCSNNVYEMAERIFQDEIDILIDLDSITLDLSCEILSLKPAPIQVTWLGWDGSGLPTIDYFIADPYVLPENAQEHYSETIWRLPQTYLAIDGFEVGVPTLRRDELEIPPDAVIFLSGQKGYKRHADTVRLQMQILAGVPNSYFLIKGMADQAPLQQFFIEIAEAEGVSRDRLRFLPETPSEMTHRANLGIADVVLDTYPYNGATTTMETLWMGIPLVTRVGQQFAARNSYTMMVNAGIEEGIAWTDEEYVEWGIRLGNDAALRQQVAWKLQRSRQTSPLWNARQFTREMEAAYGQMWANYVKTKPAQPSLVPDADALLSGERLIEIKAGVQVCVKDDLHFLTTYVLLEQGDWFEAEMEFVRRLVRPGMNILDIGANHGVYTLTMAQLLQNQGQIVAYEPASAVGSLLQKSVEANGFTTVEVVHAGLSDHAGTASLFVSPNSELNSLQHGELHQMQETIQLLTLDQELAQRGWLDISFIKLDAEGEEPKILAGGQRFFMEQSPLVMFELKHGKQINLPLIHLFQQLGYDTYRLIPGLNLLAPFDLNQPVDAYQLNLFACKADRAQQLMERDLLVQTLTSLPALPTPSYWLEAIATLNYAQPCLSQWRSWLSSSEKSTQTYLKGLSYFFLAKSAELTPEERLASLQAAFDRLQQAFQEQPSWARACSLARVAAGLGQREVSTQILHNLSDLLGASQGLSIDEPFLPVHSKYDSQPLLDNWQDYLFVSVLETYESSRAFSAYFSPQESVAILSQVVQKPGGSDRTQHRLRLAKQLLADRQNTGLTNTSSKTPPSATKNIGSRIGPFAISDIFTPSRLSIVDIGAMEIGDSEDRLTHLSKRGLATIIGFEPLPEECARLNQTSDASRRYLPYAIADGSKRTLYVTNTGMTSSLLPPNPEVTSLFMNLSELMQVVALEEVETRRLDDIPEIAESGCDLLKVDVQGLEFEIFCHASTVLSNCLIVQTEVEFVPLYQNQPLFAEVDQVLRQNGFVFHKFLGLAGRPFKPLMQDDNPNAPISQMLWSDAVYVRDFTRLQSLTPEQLLKLATLLHELYHSVDLCHHVLTIYDNQTGAKWASKYLERLVWNG